MNPDHPATSEVRKRWHDFKSLNLLRDVRNQAALNLHAASIFHASRVAEIGSDGAVIVKIPDPVKRRVDTADELSYEQGRDVLTFANALLSAAEAFVDDVLDVFVRWRPDRFEGGGGTWSPLF